MYSRGYVCVRVNLHVVFERLKSAFRFVYTCACCACACCACVRECVCCRPESIFAVLCVYVCSCVWCLLKRILVVRDYIRVYVCMRMRVRVLDYVCCVCVRVTICVMCMCVVIERLQSAFDVRLGVLCGCVLCMYSSLCARCASLYIYIAM